MNHGYFAARLIGLSFLASTVQADVYKYVDNTGHVYYTDNPRHSGYELILKSPPGHVKPARPTPFQTLSLPLMSQSQPLKMQRQQYEPVINLVARKYHLDAALLHAVVRAESAYNPHALSNKGAVGLMQLMPDTALRYGVDDPYNPVKNIDGGAHYLSDLINRFDSDIRLAVAAYNAGENSVIKYGNRIPPYAETRDYVSRVLQYYYQVDQVN